MKKNEKTSFFEKAYTIAKQIPKGRVTTYGLIAKKIGDPRAARVVGWAMNASHNREDIPAHRVVNRNGLLSGKNHFATQNMMQKKLEQEGIKVKNNQIVDFNQVLWIP